MGQQHILKLPVGGIVITLTSKTDTVDGTPHLGGSIQSDLKEDGCDLRCQGAYDAIESLVLAHAIAGVDVVSPAYLEGIEEAIQALENHF